MIVIPLFTKKISILFSSDVAPFIEFLKTIQDGTVVLMATYDDGATKYVKLKPSTTLGPIIYTLKSNIFSLKNSLLSR